MENLLHVQVKTQLQVYTRSFAIKFVNCQRLFIRVQIGEIFIS